MRSKTYRHDVATVERSRVYVLEWVRWASVHQTPDGWLHPYSKDRELYDPTLEPALPTELARVNRAAHTAHTEDLVARLEAFINQYGFLGQTVLSGRPRALTQHGVAMRRPRAGWVPPVDRDQPRERVARVADGDE